MEGQELAVEDSYRDAGGRDLLRQAAFGDQVDAGVAAGSTDRPVGDQRAVGEPGPGSVTRPESGRPEWFQRGCGGAVCRPFTKMYPRPWY